MIRLRVECNCGKTGVATFDPTDMRAGATVFEREFYGDDHRCDRSLALVTLATQEDAS